MKSSVNGKGDGAKIGIAAPQSQSSSSASVGWAGGLLVPFMICLVYYMVLSCTKTQCAVFMMPVFPREWLSYVNKESVVGMLGLQLLILLLSLVPVGSVVQGMPLRDGRKLNYRCNAWLTQAVIAGIFGYALQTDCPMDFVEKNTLQLLTVSVIYALVLALLVHIWGRNAPLKDRSPGADGTFLNDYWTGRVLNPRCGIVDIKLVIFRSAMIVWLVFDWMYMAASFKKMHIVDPALATVVICHTLYITFTIRNEKTFFSSTDFAMEGVGFMFILLCTSFMPLIPGVQVHYLYHHPGSGLNNKFLLGGILLMDVVGLVLFVGANWQKNAFRQNPHNPELAHLSSIPTSTGKRILTSGWWGIVRRPNYLGDLMMALAFSLPCGFNHAIPYFYFYYLVILLVARVLNDEKSCKQRYGDAWDKYVAMVPYRLVPYVF